MQSSMASWCAITGDGSQPAVTLWHRAEASPHDVWLALTDPEQLPQWFGAVQRDRDAIRVRVEVDGVTEQFEADVLECVADEHLRLAWWWDADSRADVSLWLTPDGDGTVIRLTDSAVEEFAVAEIGSTWSGVISELVRYVAGEPGVDDVADEADLRRWELLHAHPAEITRTMRGSADAVWLALTTRSGLRRWWWPHDPTAIRQLHAVPGGAFRLSSSIAGASISGEVIEVIESEALALSWQQMDTNGVCVDEAVDVRLDPHGDEVHVRVRHTGPFAQADAAAHVRAWRGRLDELAHAVEGAS